ncbi:HNH endonuclease signature motif containing protein [Mesorhizobium sp. WSM1497]|uniref:HNH endonuclease n=1 Tax=Mesorhizobium sp. WSM1497 TaxID=278153 RepID=UPI000A9259F8|nr:HNH endonuclease signature motif containing protein [Mesorhizobium sp. WSM1497]
MSALQRFLAVYDVCPPGSLEDADTFSAFTAESDRFHDAIDEITDEVFHILFNDVGFLQSFNKLCADYIEYAACGEALTTRAGRLKRTAIPVWARLAIFHRDKGECRTCKKSLAAIINQLDTERYDHIVALARFGANDVTNLQLLCEPCNLVKSAGDVPVSRLYQKAIPR